MISRAPLSIRFEPPYGTAKNPYLPLLARALRDEGQIVEDGLTRPEILHLHWPEAPFNEERAWTCAKSVGRAFLEVRRMRRAGTTVVWTVHNLRSHEHRWPGEARYRNWLIRHVDGWLTLSEHAREVAADWPGMSDLPHAVIPLGDVAAGHRPTKVREEARTARGLPPGIVIATFGRNRPYKGFDQLVDAFAALPDREPQLLLTSPTEALTTVERSVRDRIIVQDEPLSDTALADLIRSADLIVLPYRAITHSASAVTAVGLERRVLVPAIGALVEMAAEFPEWMRTYEPPLGPDDLESALAWLETPKPTAPDLGRYDWRSIATLTIDLYQQALR